MFRKDSWNKLVANSTVDYRDSWEAMDSEDLEGPEEVDPDEVDESKMTDDEYATLKLQEDLEVAQLLEEERVADALLVKAPENAASEAPDENVVASPVAETEAQVENTEGATDASVALEEAA